jgi:hypothetical protein
MPSATLGKQLYRLSTNNQAFKGGRKSLPTLHGYLI